MDRPLEDVISERQVSDSMMEGNKAQQRRGDTDRFFLKRRDNWGGQARGRGRRGNNWPRDDARKVISHPYSRHCTIRGERMEPDRK